jgi:4-hydroxy-tetrahydrodipicolinate reductase
MIKIIIVGANGRMGRTIGQLAENTPGLEIAGQIKRGDAPEPAVVAGDVIIDFSTPEATVPLARLCAREKKAMVIGVTGHEPAQRQEFTRLSAEIPIVLSANFSTGVNTLFWLAGRAAQILGPGYDLEIVEMHHRLKKDAPSGTALALAKVLAHARQEELDKALRHGREGVTGERSASEIGIHSVRGGDVVGDHTVIFANRGERVELSHKASSRETFASGALRAALWIVGKPPGLYDMQDVLGLK